MVKPKFAPRVIIHNWIISAICVMTHKPQHKMDADPGGKQGLCVNCKLKPREHDWHGMVAILSCGQLSIKPKHLDTLAMPVGDVEGPCCHVSVFLFWIFKICDYILILFSKLM